uniref:Uncharacterized protein n=1 Tax=Anguilla anguilla TaxID=7936 RepID=A0A0E9QF65_ANGAN
MVGPMRSYTLCNNNSIMNTQMGFQVLIILFLFCFCQAM